MKTIRKLLRSIRQTEAAAAAQRTLDQLRADYPKRGCQPLNKRSTRHYDCQEFNDNLQ